jgi:hypothetical protein
MADPPDKRDVDAENCGACLRPLIQRAVQTTESDEAAEIPTRE